MSSLKDRVEERRRAAGQQTTPPPKTVTTTPTKQPNTNTTKPSFEKVTSTVVLNGPDVDIMDNLDLWVKKSRIRIGRKIGLTAYTRAGLRLLNDLTKTDPVAAESLIRSTADKE